MLLDFTAGIVVVLFFFFFFFNSILDLLSEPEFYGDLVYRLKKIVGSY